MTKLMLLVAVTLAILATVAAQTRYCGASYYTCNPDGKAETGTNDKYTECTASTLKTKCIGKAPNPKCTFSMRLYKQICCYDVIVTETPATPPPGSTFDPSSSTDNPLIRNLKPLCPNGALGYGGTQVLPCNKTNLAKAGCPNSDYSCEKAVNVYDVFGTPADISDDVGAAQTPFICCQVASMQSFETVFSSATVGLTPSIIPTAMAPKAGIAAFFLPTPQVNVYLGDDRSTISNQLSTLEGAAITFFSPTAAVEDSDRYHVLFFDATTNKDCVFWGNLPGDGSYQLKLMGLPLDTNATADNTTAAVFTNDTTLALASKPYYYGAPYGDPVVFGPANTDKHKFVVLVWQTTVSLNFGPDNTTGITATVRDNNILLGTGPYGDFVPTTDKANGGPTGGKFTTVTAFLQKSKVVAKLGQPIAGTYFWAKK